MSLKKKTNIKKINIKKNNSFINFLKLIAVDGYNYNAKIMDLVLFFVILEVYINNLLITYFFFYLYFFRELIIFFGNIFIVNKKEFVLGKFKKIINK